MKGIILAGGSGSRLFPLTKITNKHLLPVYKKPMIYYPLETLAQAGIKDIMIVSGKGHAGHFLELLGSGQSFGVNLSYSIQEEAGGIAQALNLTRRFVDNDKVIVFLGDNILEDDITQAVQDFEKTTMGAKIFLKEVQHPEHYGIAQINNHKIENIVEKPQEFISNLAVVGVYMYDSQVWDVIHTLKPSNRGELEITDVNNFYVQQGTMKHDILKGWWADCGESIDTWLDANNLLANRQDSFLSPKNKEQIEKMSQKIISETLEVMKKQITNFENPNPSTPPKHTSALKNKKVFEKPSPDQEKLMEAIVQDEDAPFDINNYYSK